ncbi:hypothetical protein GE061_007229 [Apolygus lucorum]|uniref:Uncharacterized protein n=1 Tax=Apolygus lucorum TaxID=248454 RepID=A0A8S9WSK0_APOLU|nr:hypothetical protein GE061_007229 [Apolygus lucorum]
MKNRKVGMSVEEAMKVLNMKRFDSEELNDKFRYRVQSVAQGLGGSITAQKDIYTAWEYLNRMLARESSTHTEDLLTKVDKSIKMFEKPKLLEISPLKLSNQARRSSLAKKKSGKKKKPASELKSILKKVEGSELTKEKLPPISKLLPVKTAGHVNAGGGSRKRVRWMDCENVQAKPQITKTNKPLGKNAIARNMMFRLLGKQENHMLRQEGATEISRSKNMNDEFRKETKESTFGSSLGTLLDELPKLIKKPRTRFKRVPRLNEIFVNPRRRSRHDQRAAARREIWREQSEHLLKELVLDADKKRRAHTGGALPEKLQVQVEELDNDQYNSDKEPVTGEESKVILKDVGTLDKAARAQCVRIGGILTRKSLQKQEEVLYSEFSKQLSPTLPSSGRMLFSGHEGGGTDSIDWKLVQSESSIVNNQKREENAKGD